MLSSSDLNFGDCLLEGLREALSWKRGEIAVDVRYAEPMPRLPDRPAIEAGGQGQAPIPSTLNHEGKG